MRVLIVSPYRTVAPHFEHELEIAQLHLDKGDQVTFLSCLGELDVCDFNTGGDARICNDCRLRRANGIQKLEGPVNQLSFDQCLGKYTDRNSRHPFPGGFVSVEQLKQSSIGNFDLGYATLSSLVSQVRDPEPDLSQYRSEVDAFAKSAALVHQAMIRRIAKDRPDRVYVFNGRFAAMRAVLRACQQEDIECLIHERGCDTEHYQLYRDRLPHDVDYIHARMLSQWNQAATDSDRIARAKDWFQSRVMRVEKNWHSFVKGQQRGCLPDVWNPRDHNIVLFTSSEDEFVAIGDCWTNQIYPDQAAAIPAIARELQRLRPDARLTVRVHPNLIGINNASTRRMAGINLPNVTIIPPEAVVDSYQLMRVANSVVTFGSSIGIESVFWGRPSILLGPCFYQYLKGPLRAKDHQHAVNLMASNQVPATTHEALVYGYWQNTHGIRFRYFEPDGLFGGTFRGEVVYPKPRKTLGGYIARRLESVAKRFRLSDKRRAA